MKYLKLWTSFRDVMRGLSDDEKGRLFDMMLVYAETMEEPEEISGNERIIWPAAKVWIDMAYSENQKQKENGGKGGRPPKTQPNPTEPEETQQNPTKPTETQQNPTKAYKVKESNIKECKVKENKKGFVPPTQAEVETYCRERGNRVDASRFVDFYESKGWRVGNQPMKDWRAAVRTWEREDNRGTDNRIGKPVAAQDYQQRDYSNAQQDAVRRFVALAGGKTG